MIIHFGLYESEQSQNVHLPICEMFPKLKFRQDTFIYVNAFPMFSPREIPVSFPSRKKWKWSIFRIVFFCADNFDPLINDSRRRSMCVFCNSFEYSLIPIPWAISEPSTPSREGCGTYHKSVLDEHQNVQTK